MIRTSEIIKTIEKFAPSALAEDWDNTGWQINLYNPNTKKIMICVSVTPAIVKQAIELGCDMIICHHPLIFHPIRKINDIKIIKAIQNNIQIYAVHTNADKTIGGTTDTMARMLQLKSIEAINDFVKIGSYKAPVSIDEFISILKLIFNVEKIKVSNLANKKVIKNIALCAGAGSEFLGELHKYNIDAYVTGDLKYHDVVDINKFAIFDIGHYESEKPFVEQMTNIIRKAKGDKIEIVIANEKPAWNIL